VSTDPQLTHRDPFDARRAFGATGLLAEFNVAGVLTAGDVHVAQRLGELLGESDEQVLLAAAFAVRAPRMGHVCVDLSTVIGTVTVDAEVPVDLDRLPWPDAASWAGRVAASSLVAHAAAPPPRPMTLEGNRLYLDRYWRDEGIVAHEVIVRAQSVLLVDEAALDAGLGRLFGDGPDDAQRRAAEHAVREAFTVISGGPGTGKTTTVARILGLICEQSGTAAPGVGALRLPLIALAAPTGKAADRLQEAVVHEAASLDVGDRIRGQLAALESSTLHRLLGSRRGRGTGFVHGAQNRLPHDVVVVDEASMVSLSLMARLLEALREDARLILVGDAGQLASVEAGAVLGDIVGPAATEPDREPLGGHIVVLQKVHRYGPEIGALADAVRAGDDDAVMAELCVDRPQLRWISPQTADGAPGIVRTVALAQGRTLFDAAAGGFAGAALEGLGTFRVLCARRRGPQGVAAWTRAIEGWLTGAIDGFSTRSEWYVGRPVLVTQNDYGMGLFNGDTGVVVAGPDGRPRVAFARAGEVVEISPYRLGTVETVHAMTIHKSQGSQFASVVVVVPDASSRLLTRELLYTAITRARSTLIVVGTEQAIRAAVRRPIARASGLRERLWDEDWPMIVYGSHA